MPLPCRDFDSTHPGQQTQKQDVGEGTPSFTPTLLGSKKTPKSSNLPFWRRGGKPTQGFGGYIGGRGGVTKGVDLKTKQPLRFLKVEVKWSGATSSLKMVLALRESAGEEVGTTTTGIIETRGGFSQYYI